MAQPQQARDDPATRAAGVRNMHFEEFALRLEDAGAGRCTVLVMKSPYGSGARHSDFVFTREGALDLILTMERTRLSRSQQATSRGRELIAVGAPAADRAPQEALGDHLFRSLFAGTVRERFLLSLGNVENRQDTGLRIRLHLDPSLPDLPEISSLPWELIYRTETRAHLARNRFTPLVRYLEVPRLTAPAQLVSSLRILVVRSRPRDSPPIDSETEIEQLVAAWQEEPRVEIEILDRATLPLLRAALLRSPFHVLHFIGHGAFATESGEGCLIFEDQVGMAQEVKGRLIGEVLQDCRDLRLVFLNACDTARLPRQRGQDPFSGVASALVMAGLPAVLAMQFPISDGAALVFSKHFYASLAAGFPVDAAAAEGRLNVHLTYPNSWEWATPALFMSVPDGRIVVTSEAPLATSLPPPVPLETPASAEAVDAPPLLPQGGESSGASRTWRQRLGSVVHLPDLGNRWLWCALVPFAVILAQHLWVAMHGAPVGMVRIPAGFFRKGGLDTPMIDLLRRHANIDAAAVLKAAPETARVGHGFAIDRYEVTNQAYAGFLAWVHALDAAVHRRLHPDEPSGKRHDPEGELGIPTLPVVGIDWYDAKAFCQWAGKRLPTSDEWERAARGDDGRLYPWGNAFDKAATNGAEGPETQPTEGGRYGADKSPDGVFDMAGNVSEWTATTMTVGKVEVPTVAGGSWAEPVELYGLTFLRRAASPLARRKDLGVRCVRDGDADPPDGMVSIPAGSFRKGGEDSIPLRILRRANLTDVAAQLVLGDAPETAWLGEFYLDRYEVTNDQYGRFLRAIGTQLTEAAKDGQAAQHPPPAFSKDALFDRPDQPVVGINWYDAVAYCHWAGKRLPSSDEWERAARGTDGRLYPWGSDFDLRCNTRESGTGSTWPVGSHPRCVSPEGVLDLVGNADEWVADQGPGGDRDSRVIRGGSWNDPGELRGMGYLKSGAAVDYHGNDIGFRCAASPRRSWLEQAIVRLRGEGPD